MKESLFKKLIAILLALATLVLAGCQNNESVNEDNPLENISQNDVVNQEENSQKEETSDKEEETTGKKEAKPADKDTDISVTIVDGIISNTDRNNFSDMLGHMIWHNGYFESKHPEGSYSNTDYFLLNYENYDYRSEKAKRFAYKQIFATYETILEEMAGIYNWQSFEIEVVNTGASDNIGPSDPKGWLDYNYSYCKVEEKYVDMCLKTVFNLTPDHDYVFKSKDGEVVAYYYDGWYYYCDFDGGDTMGPDVDINDIEIMNDGKFLIKATYYVGTIYSATKICDVNVVAEMKEVEGKSIWSFYRITKV